MGRIARLARRSFLIGTAAVAGGLAFGVYLYKKPHKNPLLARLGKDEAALTPYVRLDSAGVTIITPRADLGQGAYSIQAALVAEELDVKLEDIRVEPGPPSPAYYNGAVAAEGLPFAAIDQGVLAESARVAGDVAAKFLGLQVTGGSSTVPDAFEKLRIAGAVARETLILAAAQETGIAAAELKTEDGKVVTADGRAIPYSALAATAARVAPPGEVTLRPESEWRYLGKPMRRVDIVAKSTGRAAYGIDLRLPDMVYGTVRSNPRRGAGRKSYDLDTARKARGVFKAVPVSDGIGVIADNSWRAFRAAGLAEIEWGAADYPPSSEAMFAAVAASFTGDREDSRLKDEGDVEKAFEGGEVLVAEYRVPYLAHAPLEPMNAVVQLTKERLDIWTGTQIPLFMRQTAARMTGLAEENIHIHAQLCGGSFGRRLEDDYVRQAIELAQNFDGRPIKMTWTREEDMSHDFPRPLGMARMRGAVRDGQVAAYDLKVACPSVTASQLGRIDQPVLGPDVAIVAGAWDQPYTIPNYRVTGYRVPAMAGVSSWRSVGASGNGFFHEGFLDELIWAARADPLAERIRLCSHAASRRVLQAVGEMAGWQGPLGGGRGRGVAFTLSFGVPCAEIVEVTATEAGIKIDKVFAAAEVGRVLDPVNFENQVQGGVIWGLGHAVYAEITYEDGAPQQSNFPDYEGLRLYQVPEIQVRGLENSDQIRGIGEPPVPPAAPALANAIFAATGKRIRELPLNKEIDFL